MSEQVVFLTARPQRPSLPHGIEKALEDDDPYALTGVRYPVADGVDSDCEVGLALVEEFALSGWPPDRIARLFSAPQSGSMHEIFQRRGRGFVDDLLIAVFGPNRLAREAEHG